MSLNQLNWLEVCHNILIEQYDLERAAQKTTQKKKKKFYFYLYSWQSTLQHRPLCSQLLSMPSTLFSTDYNKGDDFSASGRTTLNLSQISFNQMKIYQLRCPGVNVSYSEFSLSVPIYLFPYLGVRASYYIIHCLSQGLQHRACYFKHNPGSHYFQRGSAVCSLAWGRGTQDMGLLTSYVRSALDQGR